jgi:hypothetical protein
MNAGRNVKMVGIAIGLSMAIAFGMLAGTDPVHADGRQDGQHTAGQIFRVGQTGLVCTFTLLPNAAGQTAAGGASSVALTASSTDCGWTAVGNAAWIVVSPGSASGTGNGTVSYTIAASSLQATRIGTLTIAGLTFTVTQAGKASPRLWSAPAPIVFGTALSATQLNAAASVAGTFAYTPPSGTVLGVGTGQPLSVTFTPTDLANYTTATSSVTIDITSATPSITSLTPSVTFPSPAGTSITWTATAPGGIAPLQYQFWKNTNWTGWVIVQSYSTSPSYTWTAPTAGSHQVLVGVRNAGSVAIYDASLGTGAFSITSTVPLAVTALTPTVTFPSPAGTAITWTSTANGGVTPLQYQFWRNTSYAGWVVAQPYSTSPSYTWSSPTAGTSQVFVGVRNAGSGALFDVSLGTGAFSITSTVPLAVTAVIPSVAFPSVAGAAITWTATANGGVAPLQYQFWRNTNYAGWVVVQAYSTSPSYTWISPTAGTSQVFIGVRNAGSGALFDVSLGSGAFVITP